MKKTLLLIMTQIIKMTYKIYIKVNSKLNNILNFHLLLTYINYYDFF